MTSKLMQNKRREHAEKILEKASGKNGEQKNTDQSSSQRQARTSNKDVIALRAQYKIIREDFTKLRNDLIKGLNLAKVWMSSKSSQLKAK